MLAYPSGQLNKQVLIAHSLLLLLLLHTIVMRLLRNVRVLITLWEILFVQQVNILLDFVDNVRHIYVIDKNYAEA